MILVDLPARVMANASNVVGNITSNRAADLINYAFGGDNWNQTDLPNWGSALWAVVNVYPDYVGQVAWFVLFCIPFLMMWITHADMLPAAVVGVFLGIYVVGFVGAQYFGVGVAILAMAITSVVVSVYIRRM